MTWRNSVLNYNENYAGFNNKLYSPLHNKKDEHFTKLKISLFYYLLSKHGMIQG
jgi:hypothetical protein